MHSSAFNWCSRHWYVPLSLVFIPSDEVGTYFSASDVVVLPYKNASQSGIIPLAYSYQRPVIASDIKGIREMVIDGKTGILFEKNDSKSVSYTHLTLPTKRIV